MINWNKLSKPESDTILLIAKRAAKELGVSVMTTEMDLAFAHTEGCILDLHKLLNAPSMDFNHDILGIARHINRENGKMEGCFSPRCAYAAPKWN